jgi:hypothetical protein
MGKRRGEYRIWWGNVSYRGHLEDKGVDGKIILRWIFKKKYEDVNCIDPAQITKMLKALMNAAMNDSFPYNAGDFVAR